MSGHENGRKKPHRLEFWEESAPVCYREDMGLMMKPSIIELDLF